MAEDNLVGFRHYETKETFNAELAQGLIKSGDLSFIKDSNEIHTHNKFYKGVSWSIIEPALPSSISIKIADNSSHQVTLNLNVTQGTYKFYKYLTQHGTVKAANNYHIFIALNDLPSGIEDYFESMAPGNNGSMSLVFDNGQYTIRLINPSGTVQSPFARGINLGSISASDYNYIRNNMSSASILEISKA